MSEENKEFTPITTQEELNALIGKRVKSAKDELEKLKAEYEQKLAEMAAAAEASAKKYAKIDQEMADKDAKIKSYETNSVKMRIAHELGLKYEAASFLQGEDEESIRKSAEALKSLTGGTNAASAPARPSPAFKESKGEVDGVTAAFRKMNPNLKI